MIDIPDDLYAYEEIFDEDFFFCPFNGVELMEMQYEAVRDYF